LGYLDLVKTLVEFGANINALDFEGNTALHLATIHVHSDCVRYLVRSLDLSVAAKNLAGQIPIDMLKLVQDT
jgi:ankyrin repeat protein